MVHILVGQEVSRILLCESLGTGFAVLILRADKRLEVRAHVETQVVQGKTLDARFMHHYCGRFPHISNKFY